MAWKLIADADTKKIVKIEREYVRARLTLLQIRDVCTKNKEDEISKSTKVALEKALLHIIPVKFPHFIISQYQKLANEFGLDIGDNEIAVIREPDPKEYK